MSICPSVHLSVMPIFLSSPPFRPVPLLILYICPSVPHFFILFMFLSGPYFHIDLLVYLSFSLFFHLAIIACIVIVSELSICLPCPFLRMFLILICLPCPLFHFVYLSMLSFLSYCLSFQLFVLSSIILPCPFLHIFLNSICLSCPDFHLDPPSALSFCSSRLSFLSKCHLILLPVCLYFYHS